MRFLLAAAWAIAGATTVLAQTAQPTVSYRGRVIDAATGQGLAGATVELRPAFDPTNFMQIGQPYKVQTDDKGGFSIAAAPAELAMMVTLEGYAQEDPYSRPVSLKIDNPLPPATVRMVRGATVSGVVEDEQERPLAGITVELIDSLSAARSAGLRKRTGPDGTFTITSVAPGSYVLRGVVQRTVNASTAPPQYAPTYFPGSVDGAGAAAIQVYSGIDVPNLHLRMRKAEFYSVSGTVAGRESNTTGAVAVRLQRVEDPRITIPNSIAEAPIQAPIAADGTFRLERVMPGSYTAIIQTDLARIVFPLGSQNVIVTNRNVEDIKLTVQPGGVLAGKLIFEDGTFHPGNWPMVLEGRTSAGNISTPVRFSETGTFSVDGLPSGTYRFNFSNRGTIAVNKVQINGRAFEGSKFEFVLPGDSGAVITVSESGGAINGSLEGLRQADEIVTGTASAALLSGFNDRLPVIRTEPLAKDGTFSLKTLEPGRYLVCAWRDLAPAVLNLLQSAIVPLQRIQQDCKTVTLTPNGSGSAQLKQTSIGNVTR